MRSPSADRPPGRLGSPGVPHAHPAAERGLSSEREVLPDPLLLEPWAAATHSFGPHITVPPQPSGTVSQSSNAGQLVAGVQPHTLGVPPPPQVWGALHVPQLRVPPQPSGTVPQLSPAGQLAAGLSLKHI
jgi:hypothetical protein